MTLSYTFMVIYLLRAFSNASFTARRATSASLVYDVDPYLFERHTIAFGIYRPSYPRRHIRRCGKGVQSRLSLTRKRLELLTL